MVLLLEAALMCFLLLLICVIGIANGPVGLVVLYEQDVQDRVVELGYTTKEKIRKSFIITCIVMFAPMLVLPPPDGLRDQRRSGLLGRLLADDRHFVDHGPV